MNKLRLFIIRVKRRLKKTALLFLAGLCRSIVVFAPIYTKDNEKDGYIQRIKTIDETVLSKHIRFYITGDHPELEQLRIRRIGKGLYSIEFNSGNIPQLSFINDLITKCGILYIHSVYRLLSINTNDKTLELLDIPKLKIIWDVHGAVPEECHLLGNYEIEQIASKVEKRLYEVSDVIICVSRAMEIHLEDKYGERGSSVFILLPIVRNTSKNHLNKTEIIKNRSVDEKPVVIYSGGLQKWQNVIEMIKLAKATADYYDYRFLVPDPQRLIEMIPADILGKIQIRSASAYEIEKDYRECHFGLLLRDDNIVNSVACPTKIVEYLEYGVLPVLKSENIGDFKELGMKYVRIEDFVKGSAVSEKERCEMAMANTEVLQTIIDQQKKGSSLLKTKI